MSVELEIVPRGARQDAISSTEIRKISNMINFAYVRQGEPLGLGHAVLGRARARRRRAVRRDPRRRRDRRRAAGDQADDRRVRAASTARCSRSSACRRRTSRATAIASTPSAQLGDGVYQVARSGRKAAARRGAVQPGDHRPLHPDARHLPGAGAPPRATGPARSSSPTACASSLKSRPIYACEVNGVRHDTGNKLGFLKAVVYFALRRPDLRDKFSAYLTSLEPGNAGRQALS